MRAATVAARPFDENFVEKGRMRVGRVLRKGPRA